MDDCERIGSGERWQMLCGTKDWEGECGNDDCAVEFRVGNEQEETIITFLEFKIIRDFIDA